MSYAAACEESLPRLELLQAAALRLEARRQLIAARAMYAGAAAALGGEESAGPYRELMAALGANAEG